MIIVIRIERCELEPQGLKELLAMLCENAGYGVRVVEVRRDPIRWTDPPPAPKPKRKSWEERQEELTGRKE